MEKQKEKTNLTKLIEFLNSKEGNPLVKSAIEALYGDKDNGLEKVKIDKLDKFFDIEYQILKAILDSSFNDALKNDDIINRFSVAKGELENLKNGNGQTQNELNSLIIPSRDMGIILNNLTTNCQVSSGKFERVVEESADFVRICKIINRLIDNEYNYGNQIKVFEPYENDKKNYKSASAFIEIFQYNSYKVFWQYVAKIPNIEFYFNNLLNSEIKFKDEECQKLQNRFLEYQKVRGKILEECTNKIREDPTVRRHSRPAYDIGFSIDKDGTISLVKEVEILGLDINGINDKKPFSFWKIILLLAIVLAFGGTGFFGFNVWLAFIAFITNFWSIIITIVALIALSILLVVAHKTDTFKGGKLFCSGKYENDSWFYLRQGKEHENESEISKDNSEMEITDRELS